MSTSPHIVKNGPARPADRNHGDTDADEPTILDLGNSPRKYTLGGLLEMNQPNVDDVDPGDDLPAGTERFYALAEIDVVESTGDTVMDHHDGFVVLYATSNLSHAIEVFFRSALTTPDDVPRVKDVSIDHKHVGEMSAQTADLYADMPQKHAAVDYAIVKRAEARATEESELEASA